ncbi:MAG TPA: polysaccharide biosynthesis/export family protein [Candidatus Bathyarchaeia archaeon]|nr:polysaccharide biosynthesis/export family protein [Candidatus Bathyarchaeia archaeon]
MTVYAGESDPLRKLRRSRLVAGYLLASAFCPSLAAQTSSTASSSSETLSGLSSPSRLASSLTAPEYIISADDVLSVNVYDAPEISGEYRVGPNGQLELPLLAEAVEAAGLTPAQLSRLLVKKYAEGEIFNNARVTVSVKQSRIHSITVAGAVKNPQIYALFGKTTVLDVLSQVGGLSDDASNLAFVTRGEVAIQALSKSGACAPTGSHNGDVKCADTVTIDLKRLMETGEPASNVELYPGDRVTVQRAGIIYVVGAVNRPGGFPLRSSEEEMTVLKALALAEDTKSTAQKSKAVIIRKNPQEKNGRQEIAVNLKNVLTGRAPDPTMQANDILFVPDSSGEKALRRGVESAIYVATGLIIWRR